MSNPRPKVVFETSWDDWGEENLRIAALLRRYSFPGVFFLPVRGYSQKTVKQLTEWGFEIGGHTWNHPSDLKALPMADLFYEINTAKAQLERFVGQSISKFCYPRGRYNDYVVDMVKDAGYLSGRTTEVLQTEVTDLYRKPTTIHWFQRKEYGDTPVHEIAREYFDMVVKQGGYFHLWGHGWEIERDQAWGKLAEFLAYAAYFLKR